MEPVQVADLLSNEHQDSYISHEEFRGQVSVYLKKDRLRDICIQLRDDPSMSYVYLRDITAVDWLGKKTPRFEVVYHLYSLKNRNMIRLKVPVDEADCSVDSVVPVWRGADWHERECYDLFGISFKGHPDLRRILMPEDWKGHPLRKDYPVKGPDPEDEWDGYKKVLEKAERYKEFEWER